MSATISRVVVSGAQTRRTAREQPGHRHQLALPARFARNALQRQQVLCRAEPEQEPKSQPPPPSTEQDKPPNPELAKGQGTAIVTGAISIIFGILYLVLVSFMDFRGGEMLPPPPEAYGP